MNSIGSSTVMMCPFISLLILSIIAASVVLLPEPVGPVTSTRPRGRSASLATTCGNPSSSNVRTVNGICRITSDTQPRCLKQLPRKRARFWMPKEKSSSFSVSNRFFWFSVSTEYASDSVSLGVMTSSVDALVMSPSIRSFGRSPATRCRSEASFSIISSSSARRFTGIAYLSFKSAAAVSFTTSSSVVTPFLTLTMPSMRSVNIPSSTATSRSSSVDDPRRIARRMGEVSSMTS